MKVVVGLGNPGSEYRGTRHNVGYALVDSLAESVHAGRFRKRFDGETADLVEGEHKLLLVKPLTYMNLSGRCVRQVVDFYQLPIEDLLVVCDDFHLPLGKLRFRPRGTAGGQKGLKSIQDHLGTTEYSRLRIGVDAPAGEAVDHVLGRFRPGERPVIEEALQRAAQGVIAWSRQGIEVCMNLYNG